MVIANFSPRVFHLQMIRIPQLNVIFIVPSGNNVIRI